MGTASPPAARASLGSGKVPIQVFRWQGGEPKTETFDVIPGDSVGLKKGDIDYNTGWTLVDIRNEDGYILLMDPSGTMVASFRSRGCDLSGFRFDSTANSCRARRRRG